MDDIPDWLVWGFLIYALIAYFPLYTLTAFWVVYLLVFKLPYNMWRSFLQIIGIWSRTVEIGEVELEEVEIEEKDITHRSL